MTTVSEISELFNYELRNSRGRQWPGAETLQYINKWLGFIHQILISYDSDLVKTGSGSFTTTEGTEIYDLSANAMGDLWVPCHVWLSGLAELEMVAESERMPYVINGTNSQPVSYYLEGDSIGLLPFPDSTEYTVNIKYIPEFTSLVNVNSVIPYKNLFNNVLVEGVKIIAKNREEYGTSVDVALMELFQDKVMSILRKRQVQLTQLVPDV
jgi:hypothetical protein